MTNTQPTAAQLAELIAAGLRAAANDCDGNCGLTEVNCFEQHPIQVSVVHFETVTGVYGYIDALAAVAATAVQPELDRLRAELEVARIDLAEMTRCRDAALRALHRDDIETDIDVEEAITNALHGPGWDWDDERTPSLIAREVAPVIRPALAKAAQQLAAVNALADRWDNALAVDKPYARALCTALNLTAPAAGSAG